MKILLSLILAGALLALPLAWAGETQSGNTTRRIYSAERTYLGR